MAALSSMYESRMSSVVCYNGSCLLRRVMCNHNPILTP